MIQFHSVNILLQNDLPAISLANLYSQGGRGKKMNYFLNELLKSENSSHFDNAIGTYLHLQAWLTALLEDFIQVLVYSILSSSSVLNEQIQ